MYSTFFFFFFLTGVSLFIYFVQKHCEGRVWHCFTTPHIFLEKKNYYNTNLFSTISSSPKNSQLNLSFRDLQTGRSASNDIFFWKFAPLRMLTLWKCWYPKKVEPMQTFSTWKNWFCKTWQFNHLKILTIFKFLSPKNVDPPKILNHRA